MFPHAERRKRLIRTFPDTIDAILLTRLINVSYLSGFTGSAGALLLGRDGTVVMATDGRYATQLATQSPDLESLETRSAATALVTRAIDAGISRLGIEGAHVTLTLYDALRGAADGRLDLITVRPMVEPLRATKDAAEIAALRRACEITDAAFADLVATIRPGVDERSVAFRLEAVMREHGAAGTAFETIVAFGPNSAIPHHSPTDRTLAPGDLVKVDFGARYDGYHADMTRTVVLGGAADWQRDLHALVVTIQADAVAATTVGAIPVELDDRVARAIEATGHRVAHGLGHGVGLEIHEDPFLTAGSAAPALGPDMVVTVEPGIYLPDRGGVRVEDTVVLTAGGNERLTTSTRELVEVG